MKGAVQGEAIATASTPDRKALATGWRASSEATTGRQEGAELEQARQVQPDQGEQRGQRRHHGRRLQLEAPAQLLAGGAQRQHQRAQAPRKRRTTPAV